MASFISALSLFVIVLISGCFTLPIGDNFLSETSSPFAVDVTTETSVRERMFSEDATISPIDGMTTEDATREPRMFNEVATDESFTFVPTTERVSQEPRMFNEMATEESFTFKPTTERVNHEPRMFDEVATEESFTFKPTTERASQEPRMFNEVATEESFTFKPTTERANQEPRMFNEVATEESFTFKPTTERSFHEKREVEDSPSDMTVEETTERDELAVRDMPAETFTESSPRRLHSVDSVRPTTEVYRGIQGWSQPSTTVEPRMTASGIHMSSTTNSMPSFSSASSTIAPEVFTRDSPTTRKYTGLLADKLDHEVESNEDEHEHKNLLGKDKFVEPTHDEKKLNKEKVVVEVHEEVHGNVKPEIEEDQFEKTTMVPKKFKETYEHEKLEIKEDKPKKFTKEEMELEEHTPELEKVKTVEHKEFVSKHDDDEKFPKGHKLDSEEPKKEIVKESHEEFKKHPKPELDEMNKESHEEMKKHPKPELDEMKESHEEIKKHPKPEWEEMKKESHEEIKKLPKPEFEKGKPPRKEHKLPMEETKKPVEKDSSEEKKTSHKQEGELEEEFYPEKFIPKRPTTPRRPQVDSDDNVEYPKALYFDKTWTSVVKIPSDFAILDETTDVVTVPDTFRPSKSVESRRDESKLNQGKESARAE